MCSKIFTSCPKYKTSILESYISDVTICSNHDSVGFGNSKYDVRFCSNYEHDKIKLAKLSRRKMLALNELPIVNFMIENYLLAHQNYLYSINYVYILFKHIYSNIRK